MTATVVIGAGAIGGFLAARLARAGQGVTLVARGGRLELLRRDGLCLETGAGSERVMVPVAADCAGMPPADLVLLCTKMDDLPAALELARPVVGAASALVTVQNGVEAHELAARCFPGATVIAGRVHGFFEGDGATVRHVGVPPSLVFGPVEADRHGRAALLGQVLAAAGIAARHSPEILVELWEKFLLAASLGGVGLALGLPAGAVRQDPAGWAMLRAAMDEVAWLAGARGIALAPDCVARTLAFVESFPPDATTSLQRDVEAGQPSEYASLTGAVLRLAQAQGLDLPCYRAIEQRIRARGLAV